MPAIRASSAAMRSSAVWAMALLAAPVIKAATNDIRNFIFIRASAADVVFTAGA
jgi:hypothetical protein